MNAESAPSAGNAESAGSTGSAGTQAAGRAGERAEAGTRDEATHDVVVVGGGIAGLAAAIHLRRRGLSVLCLEPDGFPHDRVGESLDWSAPRLLAELDVPCQSLLDEGAAIYKRNIKIVATDRAPYTAQPEPWFEKPPLGFNTVTFHVDRGAMDQHLFEVASRLGTEFWWERVVEIEAADEEVVAVTTASGRRARAPWFLDASGRGARLFARRFAIPRCDYGPEKVCFWTYFQSPPTNEGTTFYADASGDPYLAWIWEIPISPATLSIGSVLLADHVRDERKRGRTVQDIFQAQLARFPRFAAFLAERDGPEIRVTAYRSYVYERACGPNWLILGEAASLPDPLTANGVTAAMRHAAEAAAMLAESFDGGRLTSRQRWTYDTNVRRMGRAFNHSIEAAIYDWPIRVGLGVMPAQKVYTAFSYTINALYSKYRPGRWLSIQLFGCVLTGVRLWIDSWSMLGRLALRARPSRRPRALQVTGLG